MRIDAANLTFVVQGPVVKCTKEVISSIKKYFPESPIVLSTWKQENIDGYKEECSDIVQSTDPGDLGKLYENSDVKNNLNRQIVSTSAGLTRVKTKYAVKLRTDFCILNNNLTDILGDDKYKEFTINSEFRIVKQRIVATGADRAYPFFCFDFAFAGLTEDLMNLFDIPLMNRQTAQYFKYITDPLKTRYIPEQWIVISFLQKNNIKLPDYFSNYKIINEELYKMSNLNYASNFILTDFDMFGITPKKESLYWLLNKNDAIHMHYRDWINMYDYYKFNM